MLTGQSCDPFAQKLNSLQLFEAQGCLPSWVILFQLVFLRESEGSASDEHPAR
jgi:hypothetical protein